MKPLTRKDYVILLAIGSFLAICLSLTHIVVEILYLNSKNLSLEKELTLNQTALSIVQKNNTLLNNRLNFTEENLKVANETNSNFKNQIDGITNMVGVLEKLSKTDTELLIKYSKIYFLNENYVPEKLSTIPEKYILEKDKVVQLHSDVIPFLTNMLENALSSGHTLLIASSYRSFSEQAYLKSQYRVTYGTGANKFSADQGYSEHQLGTTVDLTTSDLGGLSSQFEKTDEYKWLLENAHRYGFVLSYPKENTYYVFEPWHWRFVGVELATRIYNTRTYFYAIDQREINQYLINIFENR